VSYDQVSVREQYNLVSAAYGATTASTKIRGPKGKRGIVRDIMVVLTADAVGTTTVPEVAVGATQGAAEYARFRLGTAVGTGYTAAQGVRRARSLVTGNPTPPVLSDFAAHVQLETADIPADTDAFISGVAGVGGTPAGTFSAVVTVDWV
jgi:hypothetical protein